MKTISETDIRNLSIVRNSVTDFIYNASQLDEVGLKVLDIAPQDHNGAAQFFKKSQIDTLDIDPNSGATYIADLCQDNSLLIPSNYYDVVICTEVLEHTLNPFKAADEILRVLKKDGICFVTTPFDLRIHGPLPDCWRFTEHGLKSVFSKFSDVNIVEIENVSRFLMPIHYQTRLRK